MDEERVIIDGDLLSQFLHLPQDVQEEITQDLERQAGRTLKKAAIFALLRDGSVPLTKL